MGTHRRVQPEGWSRACVAEQLRGKLPEYMVPSAIVIDGEFSVTPNGKLDRKKLPLPDLYRRGISGTTDAEEEILCSLFAEVLGLERVWTQIPSNYSRSPPWVVFLGPDGRKAEFHLFYQQLLSLCPRSLQSGFVAIGVTVVYYSS